MLQFFPGKDPVAGPRNKNYVKQCYCLPFTQKIKLPKKGPNCKVIKCQGKYVYEMRNCEDTVPSIDWCIKHNLTTDSHPTLWFDVFMPIGGKRKDLPQVLSVSQLKTWTNTKAVLYNAGYGVVQYPSFEAFLLEDTMQHIGFYMQNGLSHSPQFSYKFDYPYKNEINGFAIMNRVIGKNVHQRHRELKSFFSCCIPEMPSPPRKDQPN